MPAVRFRGGSLDGGTLNLPPGTTSINTTGGNYYEIDDSGEFAFAGSGPFGREASMIIRGEREQSNRYQELAMEAARPKSCACGRTFADLASYTVHRDPVQGCLPGDGHGQLEQVDGVWRRIGSGR
jgi:hypothetical protein